MIRYRTKGMGCAVAFFVVWLLGWTAGCVAMLVAQIGSSEGRPPIGFVLAFWACDILVLMIFLWLFRSETTFQFTANELVWTKSLGRLRRQKSFSKDLILAVRQVKDGGDGDDSFPSWGLMLVGPNFKVLTRQEIGKSDWLGPILAQWAGKPFEPCTNRGKN